MAYIALGSNMGDREAALGTARAAIERLDGTRIIGATAAEETAPLGGMRQRCYLNQMLAVSTELSPQRLLAELQAIEAAAGRERRERWAPRILDLDIVMIDGEQVDDDDLIVPHPELPNREFWLRQLQQLKGDS